MSFLSTDCLGCVCLCFALYTSSSCTIHHVLCMCMYTHLIVVLEGLQPVPILVIHLSYPLQYSGVRGNERHQLKEPGACAQGGREEMYSTCEGWLSPNGHSSGGRALTAKVRDPRFNPGWLLVFHGSLIIFPSLSSCT